MATTTYDDLVQSVHQLTAEERRRLRDYLDQIDAVRESSVAAASVRRFGRGALAHLGSAPSAADLDEARRETWAAFPREDV